MSAHSRLTRSVSRRTARRTAVAVGTAVSLTSLVLVSPASAGVPSSVARVAAGPFTAADKAESPVTVEVSYELDGKKVSAEDVVGKSGLLETTYLVRNRTTTPTEIRYKDGTGAEVVETVDLVTPYVGRLSVELPARSGDVKAEGAEILEGALGWSLVLFNPIGEPAQKLRFTMQVADAELPQAELEVAKVTPTDKSVLAKGIAAAEEASGGSTRLTEGVNKIDSSVLKLRDGATQLLDGLIKLADGAGKLNDGLADKAAPGAQKLSDGLGKAREGGGKLDDGVGQLADGSVKLRDGLGKAAAGGGKLAEGLRSSSGQPDLSGGAQQLADGLVKVRDGVAVLASEKGLPAAQDGLATLLFGLDHAPGTIDAKDPGGLIQGLRAIAAGVSNPACDPAKPSDPANPCGLQQGLGALLHPEALPKAAAGVSESRKTLEPKVTASDGTVAPSDPTTPLNQLSKASVAVGGNMPPVLDTLAGACATAAALQGGTIQDPKLKAGCDAYTAPTTAGQLKVAAGAVKTNVPGLITATNESYPKLVELEAGLTRAVGGLTLMKKGVDERLAPGTAATRDAVAGKVIPGVQQLLDGVTRAVSGITGQLAPGVDRLATGSQTLAEKTGLAADGAGQLRAGLGQLADGGVKLSDGLGKAKDGTAKLHDGLVQLDDGGAKLATGLNDAADGSGKIEDGIIKVRDGVEKVRDGSNELSGRGTSALAGAVNNTARTNAQKVAMLKAIGEMSDDASTEPSFDIVLAGASSDAGDGISTTALVGGAAVLALLTMAAAGALVARRRNGTHAVAE